MEIDFNKYDSDFYARQSNNALKANAAKQIVRIVLDCCQSIKTVVDIGCGAGVWGSEFLDQGVSEYRGIDGKHVNRKTLLFPEQYFTAHNLQESIILEKQFDLACSLEVAEHLTDSRAEGFVGDLCKLSKIVLFSAAIPGQGGENHINERWPEYWAEIFRSNGYLPIDLIRPVIWTTRGVQTCYKQNVLLYVHEDEIAKNTCLLNAREKTHDNMLSLVHPLTLKRLRKKWASDDYS